MPQTLAEANDILVELARLEKDMVAVAGLHGEQLTARQAEMSSNLKCIVGCIYAKELITAISEASGVECVAFLGRELGELPLGWYTPLVLGSDAKMFGPIWIISMFFFCNSFLKSAECSSTPQAVGSENGEAYLKWKSSAIAGEKWIIE